MNNKLKAARREFELANNAFGSALLANHENRVPKVPRVCPVTGRHHENQCDEYFNLIYGDFTPKKFTALLKVYPGAEALAPLAQTASTALAALLSARLEDRAAKTAAKAARAERAAYKEAHGARPEEKGPNPHAPHNFDVLTVALAETRAEFVAAYVRNRVDAERAAFEAKRAAVAAKPNAAEWERRRYEAGFAELSCRQKATESAKFEFDSYVAKLATKIEARVSAVVSLTGSLWHGSVLTVEVDGGQQVWSTTCKRNARYGDHAANGHYTEYYQFPSVRVS